MCVFISTEVGVHVCIHVSVCRCGSAWLNDVHMCTGVCMLV